jgi:hypothetical protein
MGASFSAEKNTNIQEVFSKTVNTFVSENSQTCKTEGGAEASIDISRLKCGGDVNIKNITLNANSKVELKCLQANSAKSNIENFAETDLKNTLTKETNSMIGIDVSLDQNTTISRQINEVVNAFKDIDFMDCLSQNLSSADAIIDNIEAKGSCNVDNIEVTATSDIQMDCIQKNTKIMDALNKLNTSIQSELKNKKSGTGIIMMIIIVSIVALIIFIMIKKMKSSPPPAAIPLQMPMMQRPISY